MTTTQKGPQHSLKAYGVAVKLVVAVRDAKVSDAHLRDQAMRAAQSCALNTAEGAGRVTKADKARAFTIARGECVEACAAIEIASVCGSTSTERYAAVESIASVLYAMLTGLVR
jgi:four helix bundle protein